MCDTIIDVAYYLFPKFIMKLKYLFSTFLLVTSVCFGLSINTVYGAESTDSIKPVLSISVSNVRVSSSQYSKGDTIGGSFVVTNRDNHDIDGLSFRVQIGANYSEPAAGYKFAGTFLDVSARQGAFYLAKGQSKTLNFEYKIPDFLSGKNLGVEIAVLASDGRLIAWGDSDYFTISGNSKIVSITDASLLLSNGKKFGLGDGPTIYSDKDPKSIALNLSLKNTSGKDVVITPVLSSYRQNDAKYAVSKELTKITLAKGKTSSFKIDLPDQSYVPGIYFAELVLKDESGSQLESRIGARYIVGGNIAVVHSANVSNGVLNVNDKFSLAVDLTGRAPDIGALLAGSKPEDSPKGKVSIQIYNERNELVAGSEEDFNILGDTFIQKDYFAKVASKALRLHMVVTDDFGKQILDYSKELSLDYKTKAAMPYDESVQSVPYYIIVSGLIVLAIIMILILILMVKSRISRKQGMMAIVGVLLASSIPLSTLAGCESAGVSFTSISTPFDYERFGPGVLLYTSGAVSYNACENTPAEIDSLTVTFQNQTVNAKPVGGSWSVGRTGGHGWYPVGAMFMAGPLRVPTAPGTYVINYSVKYTAGACSGTGNAVRHIVVEPSDSTGGCGAGQFYCDATGSCMTNSDQSKCNDTAKYTPFKINSNIPALNGPVKLRGRLTARPPIVDKGDSCVIEWGNDFNSYDQYTLCKFTAPNISLEFKPGDDASPTSTVINNVNNDIPYQMVCGEIDGLTPSTTDNGVCRLNWKSKEIN